MPLTATEPRRAHLCSLSAHGFHRVNYWDWGDPGNPRVAICVHGLARNGRDFDVLAEALSSTHRVLAVDMPGRGDSEWLADANDYGFPTYFTTLTALIARSGADTVDWIGTSMGGLLGMAMAAQPGSLIARLVVNDVGPVIEAEALARIATYVGLDPKFASLAEGERYIRTVSAPFGALTDEQWHHLTASNVRERADGRWGLAYDPGIAVPFRAAPAPSDLWGLWDAIRCPTLLLRGAESDLLSAATAAAMRSRGPRPAVIEFPGVGHAPMLLDATQIAPVVAFLRERMAAPGP
ncbi:MAG: alpha/beta hydrolase [Betaproteobacteria bacterium]|nr:alpha/beta hydrolase [Betaproteobacteria bacterium]